MEYGSFIAAAIGFAPAIALMLWTLQPYTYPKVERPYFSDPTLFGMFAAGIIIGVILHAVGVFLSPYYMLVAFILEEAIKLLVLNLPRFQRRADMPFYGFGLGAGMASALAYGAINIVLTNTDPDAVSMLIIIVYSIMLSLLQISNGTTIGIGVARGQPFAFFGQATVVHLAFALLLIPFQQVADTGGGCDRLHPVRGGGHVHGHILFLHTQEAPPCIRQGCLGRAAKAEGAHQGA